LNIGAAVFYSLDNENSNNKLYVYPKFNASYKVVGDLMIFYAGAEGNLEQNSYMDFANENLLISNVEYKTNRQQYDVLLV
jgi:hypothetical protein